MDSSAHRAPRYLAALVLVTAAVSACGGESGSAQGGAAAASGTSAASAPTTASMDLIRGTVASVSPGALVVTTATGPVAVKRTQPFQVYDRVPASLADVKDSTFIGVTTVKQPDGSEQATEIHIFPAALRGMGEGSRMMTPSPNGGRRMTNGAVSSSRMTNGAVGAVGAAGAGAPSRMSNGNVANVNGSSLVVRYAGGSLKVTVPPGTPVTKIEVTSKPLTAGDQVVVPATKAADGSLSADMTFLVGA